MGPSRGAGGAPRRLACGMRAGLVSSRGGSYVAFRPVFKFMKDSPLKVLLVLGISVLSYEFVSFVVQAMLGVNGDPFGGPVRGGNGGF